jgi:hypothetical protein
MWMAIREDTTCNAGCQKHKKELGWQNELASQMKSIAAQENAA